MALWFELLVMLLATYVLVLSIGWLLWGREDASELPEVDGDTE